METKKSDQANLEKKRSLFFQMGLLLALGLAFVAFEWQVAPRVSEIIWEPPSSIIDDDIVIDRTYPDEPPPPAPPQMSMDLEIVDDGEIVLGEMPDINIEINGTNLIQPGGFTVTEAVEEVDPEIFDPKLVEESPRFKGLPAEDGFRQYTSANLNYPPVAIENGVFGRVYVQFVVDQKGNVVDVHVARSADPSLVNEAVRLIKSSSGMWTPGKQRGKPVKVRFTFPITFKLQ